MSIHITGRRIAAAITAVVAVGGFATAGLGSFVLFRGSYHTASFSSSNTRSPLGQTTTGTSDDTQNMQDVGTGATQAPSPQQTQQSQPPAPQQPAPQQPAPQPVQPAPQQLAPQPVAPSTGGGSSAKGSGS